MRLNLTSITAPLRPASRERLVTGCLLALAVLAYAFWLTNRHFRLWSPGEGLDLTFNSMLDHLLRGQFDVDPSSVGNEGFYRDGRVYAYWGVFFAMIRWPLTLFKGGWGIDVTNLSCLAAVCISALFMLKTLRCARLDRPAPAGVLYWCLVLSLLFSGPQIEFLRPSIFQEVCLWAGALAAIFVYLAVRGIKVGRCSAPLLAAMALMAGLALLARVSMGIGLYAALGLLLLVTLVRESRQLPMPRFLMPRFLMPRFLMPRFLIPIAILLSFAALAGFVNYHRWGNPFVFADYRLYLQNDVVPDRLVRTETYGLFNLSRVPFGILYYFLPVWILRHGDGHLLLEEHQRRLIDVTEMPPSSFFLTDPLLMALLCYALWSLLSARRSAGIDRPSVLAIGVGLAAAAMLMLSAISMNFRYRIEFYPLIEFGAFLGFLLHRRHASNAAWMRGIGTLTITLTVLGILGSHAVMILYKVSDWGAPIDSMHSGVVAYYQTHIHAYFTHVDP